MAAEMKVQSPIHNALQQIHPQLNREQALLMTAWIETEVSNHLLDGYQLAFIKPEVGEPGSRTRSFDLSVLDLNIDPKGLLGLF